MTASNQTSLPQVRHDDWKIPPTEWTYNGRPMAEFEDPMQGARERIEARFGGSLPRDVRLALNDAYRRGLRDGRADVIDRDLLVGELRRQVADCRPEDADEPWTVTNARLAHNLETTLWCAPGTDPTLAEQPPRLRPQEQANRGT